MASMRCKLRLAWLTMLSRMTRRGNISRSGIHDDVHIVSLHKITSPTPSRVVISSNSRFTSLATSTIDFYVSRPIVVSLSARSRWNSRRIITRSSAQRVVLLNILHSAVYTMTPFCTIEHQELECNNPQRSFDTILRWLIRIITTKSN